MYFRLKTLNPSWHFEWEVTNWQCILFMHIHDFLAFNNGVFIIGKGIFYFL
jgi:hypothetical protein